MSKIYEQKINNFAGGVSDDVREQRFNFAAIIKHFDIFSNPRRLSPYRSMEAEASTVSVANLKTYDLRTFQLGSNGKMYALGKNGSGYPQILQKTDPTTGTWSLPATSTGNAARIVGAFIEWASAFWFLQGTNQVAKWTIGGTVTQSVATVGSTITTTAQGVVFGDNLFIPYNNKIFKVSSAGAITDDVTPALPSDMRITSLAVWGNYIMIGMAYGTSATASPTGRSKVYQWDGSSTTVFNDVIDWGEGALMGLGNIEGMICGVSNKYLETPSGLTSLAVGAGSMVIRLWGGGVPRVMKELVANQAVTLGRMLQEVVVKNNKMYFVASAPFNQSTTTESTYHLGIWAFGRKNQNSDFALALDYIVDSVVDTSNFKIVSFGAAGNYWFINISADGSIYKTDDATNFTETSIYETQIIGGDPSIEKKLIGVTVDTVPLPSAGSVTLKYRKDEETSWTTIFTYNTDNGLSHSAINIESSSANLPHFRELQLRVESTGGAEITSISLKWEDKDSKMY